MMGKFIAIWLPISAFVMVRASEGGVRCWGACRQRARGSPCLVRLKTLARAYSPNPNPPPIPTPTPRWALSIASPTSSCCPWR
jgi:hypothetical protein